MREYRYARRPAPKADRIAPGSVDALIIAYKRSPDWQARALATRKTYSIYLRDLEAIGTLEAVRVRRRTLLAMRDEIAATRGNGAAQGAMRAWSALFTWAVDREWLDASPAARIRALPGGHLPAWTPAQADLAARLLPEPLRRVVVLARYTGQRRGDLVALTWSAYDGAAIRLRQQKTGRVLMLPCPPALRAELDAWKRTATSTHILTTAQGRPWQPSHISHLLPPALHLLGLPSGLNVHGLRKLRAAEMADAGCTAHEIAAITGHRSLSMVQLYTASADQERLATAAIERLTTPDGRRRKGKK